MSHVQKNHRLGMTAIAAVLALSSTPLAAQDATSAEPPLVEVPAPDPAIEPTVDPLAPEPAPEASTPAETTSVEAAPVDAAPAAKPVAKKAVTKAVRTAERPASRVSAPAGTAVPDSVAMPAPETAPAQMPMAAIEAPPEVAPATPATQQGPQLEEALPVAGGAGALILALAGAGMAVRRRRRRDDEETLDRQDYAENTEAALMPIEAGAAPEWSEPVIQPKPAPAVPAKVETTEVPDDFDTSRFGRHVQAAYRGPTSENPSLSLRKRLKLAGELDRRERKLGTSMSKPSAKPVTASVPPANDKPVMAFSGTASQAKWPEYQL
jgi:hypothetical protein